MIQKQWSYDHSADRAVVKATQDCQAIIDRNKELQNSGQKHTIGDVAEWIAEIPMVVLLQWLQEDKVFLLRMNKKEKRTYLQRKLNDPRWKYLKTIPGKA